MEGLPGVQATITLEDLKALVFNTIMPKLQEAYPGYDFTEALKNGWLQLREEKTWADLGRMAFEKPYSQFFYNSHLQKPTGKKAGGPEEFKRSARPILLVLAATAELFLDMSAHEEERDTVSHFQR